MEHIYRTPPTSELVEALVNGIKTNCPLIVKKYGITFSYDIDNKALIISNETVAAKIKMPEEKIRRLVLPSEKANNQYWFPRNMIILEVTQPFYHHNAMQNKDYFVPVKEYERNDDLIGKTVYLMPDHILDYLREEWKLIRPPVWLTDEQVAELRGIPLVIAGFGQGFTGAEVYFENCNYRLESNEITFIKE